MQMSIATTIRRRFGRRSPLRVVILLLICAGAVAVASWAFRGPAASEPVSGNADRGAIADPLVDTSRTDGLLPPAERVEFWEARTGAGGGYLDHVHLADAYIDRARASGDLADLRRAEAALAIGAESAPDPATVRVREAMVSFALHEFDAALEGANEVLETDRGNLAALTVAGDSLLELGQVEAASIHYERLAEAVPSAASWSRLGRLAFLHGETDEALRIVTDAARAALEAGFPDEIAFYHVQLGDLQRASGDLTGADASYAAALDALPKHAPASAGLARVREAQGRRDEAIALLEEAVASLPQPELVATLGDLYALRGDAALAEELYALVEAIAGLAAEESVYDRAYVLFAADHERDPDGAVRRAEAELALRRDVYGHDALAWALFAAGRLEEAADAAAQATRLGTADPRIAYHAGMIAAAMGRDAEAAELLATAVAGSASLPPLQVPRAVAALEALGQGAP
ncbi:MAG: tetratricopeptide repeat protein [Candidatus Limnocylindria bacterium]